MFTEEQLDKTYIRTELENAPDPEGNLALSELGRRILSLGPDATVHVLAEIHLDELTPEQSAKFASLAAVLTGRGSVWIRYGRQIVRDVTQDELAQKVVNNEWARRVRANREEQELQDQVTRIEKLKRAVRKDVFGDDAEERTSGTNQ